MPRVYSKALPRPISSRVNVANLFLYNGGDKNDPLPPPPKKKNDFGSERLGNILTWNGFSLPFIQYAPLTAPASFLYISWQLAAGLSLLQTNTHRGVLSNRLSPLSLRVTLRSSVLNLDPKTSRLCLYARESLSRGCAVSFARVS